MRCGNDGAGSGLDGDIDMCGMYGSLFYTIERQDLSLDPNNLDAKTLLYYNRNGHWVRNIDKAQRFFTEDEAKGVYENNLKKDPNFKVSEHSY